MARSALLTRRPLERSRHQLTYQHRLDQCFSILCRWLVTTAWLHQRWWDDAPLAAQMLVDFGQHWHSAGRRVWVLRHAILAVQLRHPHLRGHLTRAWECVRAWQLQSPLQSRVPLSLLLVQVIFATALDWACLDPSRAFHLFSLALLVRVGFEGLLRPGELLRLRACDVLISLREDGSLVGVLAVWDPKNRTTMGRAQHRMLHDGALCLWLRWLIAGLPSRCLLWPSTAASFRSLFAAVLSRAGLGRLPLSPASCRPGGATHMFMNGASVSRIKFAGGWRALNSLESYIQEAMAHLVTASLTDAELAQARSVVSISLVAWRRPPAVPWTSLFSRRRQLAALGRSAPSSRLLLTK